MELGERADRGPGVAQRRPLAHRENGEQAAYRARFRLAEFFCGVPAFRKEVLQEQALSFAADDVVDQARFPAARHPGHYDQLVMRDLQGNLLEVVLGGAGYDYLRVHGENRDCC